MNLREITILVSDREYAQLARLAALTKCGATPQTEAYVALMVGIAEIEGLRGMPPIEDEVPSPVDVDAVETRLLCVIDERAIFRAAKALSPASGVDEATTESNSTDAAPGGKDAEGGSPWQPDYNVKEL